MRRTGSVLAAILAMVSTIALLSGVGQASTPYPIRSNVNYQLCVGVRGSHYSDAAEVGTCSATATQTWSFRSSTSIGGGYAVQLQDKDVVDGVPACLGIAGSSASIGAQAWVGRCSAGGAAGDHSQAWRLGHYDNAGQLHYETSLYPDYLYYGFSLVNGHSGWCLDMHNGQAVSGNYLVQNACDERSPTQAWNIQT
jgi:hypothetical protein